MTRDAQELLTVGRELYARLGTLGDHATRMGRSLQRSVEDYNRLIGSLESRVLVSARRMGEIGLSTDEIDEVSAVTTTPRPLTAPELLDVVADRRPELDLDLGLDVGSGLDRSRDVGVDEVAARPTTRDDVDRGRAQREGGASGRREEAS